jgi:hypothetical protein
MKNQYLTQKAMVDILNPGLAKQLAQAQNKAGGAGPGGSLEEPNHNPLHDPNKVHGHDPSAPVHNPNQVFGHDGPTGGAMPKAYNPPRAAKARGRRPPAPPTTVSYDYYDYPEPPPRRAPKPKLKSAPSKPKAEPAGGIDDAYAKKKAEVAAAKIIEEAEIAERAHQTWKKSFIFPGFLLVVGLPTLVWAYINKQKVDKERAKQKAADEEGQTPAEEVIAEAEQFDDTVKSPEDEEKIAEVYKEKPIKSSKESKSK